jgi:hypothetical protein
VPAPVAEDAKKELARKAKDMIVRTKFTDIEGTLGEAGKVYKWLDVLPQKYRDEYAKTGLVSGFEATYLAPVTEAINKGESKEEIAKIVAMQIERRGLKTHEMEGKAASKAAVAAVRSATPRARTPARSAAERAAELEQKAAKLKALAEEEAKKKNIEPAVLDLARRMNAQFNSRRAQNQGKIKENARYALTQGGPSVSAANALRLAKTRRSASRAASAAKKAAAPGVSMTNMANAVAAPVTTTRRNYKKEVTIADFCKEGMALQAKSASPLTVSDVLHAMAEGRGSARAKSTASKYQELKAKTGKYVAEVNE